MTAAQAYVLVVDDDWMNRELLEAYLKLAGYRVGLANTGEQALKMIAEERPDLVMLDVRMSGMDGFEVCRRVRQDPCAHDIPVLMLTALQSEADLEAASEAGANGFVAKPYKAPDLLAQIAALLERI